MPMTGHRKENAAIAASEGRLGGSLAVDLGHDGLAFGQRQFEFGLDLAAFIRMGVAQFGALS